MCDVGVFPCLRKGTVVPEVAFVWEAVADESKLAFLRVLLDWVEWLIFRDLRTRSVLSHIYHCPQICDIDNNAPLA